MPARGPIELKGQLLEIVRNFVLAQADLSYYAADALLGLRETEKHLASMLEVAENPDLAASSNHHEVVAAFIGASAERRNSILEMLHFEGVAPRSQRNLDTMYKTVFMSSIAVYDAALSDMLTAVLTHCPKLMRGPGGKDAEDRTLTYQNILRYSSLDDLIKHMASREVRKHAYKSQVDQWKVYKKMFRVDFTPEGIEVNELADIIAQRNLLAHNNGVVNDVYLERTPQPSLNLGETVSIDEEKCKRCQKLLERVILQVLHKQLLVNFCGPNAPDLSCGEAATESP